MLRPLRRSRLTETDRAEWATYVRLIVPLPGHTKPEPPATSPAASVAAPRAPAQGRVPPARAAHAALIVGIQPPGVDNATWQRFRTGKLPAARTLDLHGRTAQRAFLALSGFIRAAHAERLRCVEVITGRGSGETGGVLRRELPLWLNLPDLRPLVLAAAHPHAANSGSVRLLLRRIR
jgi:DNA-nicking Smr family endonuclease